MYVCMHAWMYGCVDVCMCVCMYACMYVAGMRVILYTIMCVLMYFLYVICVCVCLYGHKHAWHLYMLAECLYRWFDSVVGCVVAIVGKAVAKHSLDSYNLNRFHSSAG